jgi:putative membrane protein
MVSCFRQEGHGSAIHTLLTGSMRDPCQLVRTKDVTTNEGTIPHSAHSGASIGVSLVNNTRVSFGIGLLLAVSACAQHSTVGGAGLNAVAGLSPSTRDFVNEASSSDMFEIQSSEFAAQRSDPQTRAFASRMITDHQRTSAELMSMVNSGSVNAQIPPVMTAAHRARLDELQGLSGSTFTIRYHEAQVLAHQDAVSLYQRYSTGGDNPTLRSWASRTLPALQEHLEMAQQLNR